MARTRWASHQLRVDIPSPAGVAPEGPFTGLRVNFALSRGRFMGEWRT